MAGSITPLPVMLEEEDRKIYEALEPPKSIVVRYGYQKLIAELAYGGDAKPGCGSKLVVRTRRGIEMGEMLTTTCDNSGCSKSVSRKEMLQYIENSGGKDYPFSTDGKVLRVATAEDLAEQSRLDERKPAIINTTRQFIREADLKMKLVEVELLLGGERMIFYYTAEDWVDFRELVRRLAAEYQTRIEMRQVSEREEARLVADYEKCGQHCCCKQFLKVLKPVSMRSAKQQKATLDPTKISGRCGRLMCCLRYEDKTYAELKKRLPHRKTAVRTEDGTGLVIDSQILTQLVLVRLDGTGAMNAYPLENIEVLSKEEAKQIAEEKRLADEAREAAARERAERRASRGRGSGSGTSSKTTSGRDDAPSGDRGKAAAGGSDASGTDASGTDTDDGEAKSDEQGEGGGKRKRRRRRRRGRGRRGGKGGDNSGGDNQGGGNSGGGAGGGGSSGGGADSP